MNVLIIEDEPAAAKRLKKMILELEPNVEICGMYDSVDGSVEYLANNPSPDLIMMDIHLSDGSSFEVFDLVEVKSPVIFTTAYDEYALNAFKVNALDYLLKPIKKEELAKALKKADSSMAIDQKSLGKIINEIKGSSTRSKKILLKLGQSIRVFDLFDAAYFYSENKITFLVTPKGKRYPLDESLDQLESILDEDHFFRVNRQFLINEDSISEMYAYSKSRVKIELNPESHTDVIVSKDRSSRFKKWLVDEQ